MKVQYGFGLLLVAAVWPPVALAQAPYPARPIRLIVPYPPGGSTDLLGRTVGEGLAERLGQQVVVDNRGGASTMIGAEIAARAPADGYTLLVGTVTTLAVNRVMLRKLPYDPVRDFDPVSMLAAQPYVLALHPAVPATSVAQLIAYGKSAPGKLTMASPGVGSSGHLAGELFMHMSGAKFTHVPYKGTGPAIIDLLGGHVSMSFSGVTSVKPHAQSGKLRALGVTTAKRSAAMPDTPTIAEAGIPGYETSTWNSLVVPRGTPPAIIQRLNAEVNAILNRPEVRDRLRDQGADPDPGTPAQLSAHIQSEITRFTRLVKAVGIKIQ
jgi:tripartite-type tricarboxylate transporter receptor subunit TctC